MLDFSNLIQDALSGAFVRSYNLSKHPDIPQTDMIFNYTGFKDWEEFYHVSEEEQAMFLQFLELASMTDFEYAAFLAFERGFYAHEWVRGVHPSVAEILKNNADYCRYFYFTADYFYSFKGLSKEEQCLFLLFCQESLKD